MSSPTADLIRRARDSHIESRSGNGACICGTGFPCDAIQLAEALEQSERAVADLELTLSDDAKIARETMLCSRIDELEAERDAADEKLDALNASHRAELEAAFDAGWDSKPPNYYLICKDEYKDIRKSLLADLAALAGEKGESE